VIVSRRELRKRTKKSNQDQKSPPLPSTKIKTETFNDIRKKLPQLNINFTLSPDEISDDLQIITYVGK
jgi:hypothetical protein